MYMDVSSLLLAFANELADETLEQGTVNSELQTTQYK